MLNVAFLLFAAVTLPRSASLARAVPGNGATGESVHVVGHGVRLSLTVPRRKYPRDALVRVTVQVRNISRHTVAIAPTICGPGYTSVAVTSPHGQVVYPPAVPSALPSCGSADGLPLRLNPGQGLREKVFAILRGDRVSAVAHVRVNRRSATVKSITAGPITLTLTHGRPPHVRVRITPRWGMEADVKPVDSSQSGSPYYIESSLCPSGNGRTGPLGMGGGMVNWTRAPRPEQGEFRFLAGCTDPMAWSLVVGWLDQPVVQVDRRSRL